MVEQSWPITCFRLFLGGLGSRCVSSVGRGVDGKSSQVKLDVDVELGYCILLGKESLDR